MKKMNVWILSLIVLSQSAFAAGLAWDRVWEQLGRFHYLILHFPVVIICILPVVLAVSSCNCAPYWRKTVPTFFYLGTLSAVGATTLGLILANATGRHDALAMTHRNWAIGTCVLMVLSCAYLLIKKPNLDHGIPKPLWVFAILAAITLTIAADTGGTMVHDKLFILFE